MTKEQKILFKVAKGYLTPPEDRDNIQRFATEDGLCWACFVFDWVADDFLSPFRPDHSGAWWLPFNDESDQIRGLFALLLATMPEKDFMEFMEV